MKKKRFGAFVTDNISTVLSALGMSPNELAKRAGLSYSRINSILLFRTWTPSDLEKIAAAISIPPQVITSVDFTHLLENKTLNFSGLNAFDVLLKSLHVPEIRKDILILLPDILINHGLDLMEHYKKFGIPIDND